MMVTKINSKCYRFDGVDFEPETRSLLWQDKTITNLTYEQSLILEKLCYHAGQVLSNQALYFSTSLPDTTYSQHQNNLSSLLCSSFHLGEKILPLDVVGEHGYRVDLPKTMYQRDPKHAREENITTPLEISIDETEDFLAERKYRYILLLSCFCIAIFSFLLFLYFIQ